MNRVYRRTGTLWEGRYRAAPIESGTHLLSCYRYIELNPVRARMVVAAGDYPWSSHRANANGVEDPLVTPHALYLALGDDGEARRAAYRETFPQGLEPSTLEMIRKATHGGWAIGSEHFKAQIEALSRRRATPRPQGRKAAERRAG